ncbi:MAG: ferric reductase-like transmembrane domain-containing protein [Burkholderiales bacterium]
MPLPALIAAYAILALLPLVIGALEGLSGSGLVRELAAATGLVALAMLLLQFISSGRYEWLSGRAGIDHTMRFHQLAARALTVLVLLHPLLFLLPLDPDGWRELPARAARLFSAPHLLSGVLAWVLLLALVGLAVLRNRLGLKYEWWRASHSLAALLVAIGGAHHALATGFYSGAPWLSRYWWALAAFALALWAYLWLVKPFVLMRGAHRVVSNEEIGRGIREIVLEPASGRALRYDAGQFAWVLLGQPPLTFLDHPFSLSSAPESAPQVRLLIKARGDFSGALDELAPGARAYLDAPHGNFSLRGRQGETIALIAGGIGIAPVMGLLRHLHARRDPRPVSLVYGARDERQLVHADEIRAMAAALDLRASFFVDEPSAGWAGSVGALTAEALRGAIRGDPARCLAFLCGPTPMMLACARHLREAGMPSRQIVFERFEYD